MTCSRFILPVLAEYADAGYRDPKGRLIYSLRSNAQYYAMVFGSAIPAGIYIFVTYGFEMDSFKSLVMALAYVWGLVLAIYLMGHGLVAIPRKLFRNASLSAKLKRIQSNAAKVHEKMEDAIQNLEDLEAQVTELSQRKTGSARYLLQSPCHGFKQSAAVEASSDFKLATLENGLRSLQRILTFQSQGREL